MALQPWRSIADSSDTASHGCSLQSFHRTSKSSWQDRTSRYRQWQLNTSTYFGREPNITRTASSWQLRKAKVMLRPLVIRCQAPIWDPRPNCLAFFLIIFRDLQVCSSGTPSLTRGRVCTFLLLLSIARAVVLGSESTGDSWPYFTVSNLRLSQLGGPGSHLYYTQEQGSPAIPQDTGFV
jgi:hypothetical protein